MPVDVTHDYTKPTVTVDPAPSAIASMRDRIRAAIDATVRPQPVELNVPAVPGMTIVYSPDVTGDNLIDYATRCGIALDGSSVPTNEQNVRSSAMLLADFATAIKLDGEVWNEDGEPVTFKRKALHDMVGTDSWTEAVRALYSVEQDIILSAQMVTANAGLDGSRVVPISGR